MLFNAIKNEKFKKPQKNHLRPGFIVFFGQIFLMPTLIESNGISDWLEQWFLNCVSQCPGVLF